MVSVLFITFVICLFIGVPVAFSLGLASLAYFLGANMPIATFSQRFFAGIDSFTLLCIPGFTLAGNLMNQGGISDKLMDFCDKLVGHLTGGMAYSERFCEEISSYLKKLAPIYRFPGEEEMKSLAEGALRALESGHYQLYDPKEETA